MNTIKTLFLSALLSAAAYGVYVAVTGVSPLGGPKDPPKDWETGPQVVLSEENADQPPAASVVAPAAALPSGNNQAGGDPQAAASGQAPFDPLPQGSHPDGAVDAAIGPSPAAAMNATGPYPSTDPYASAGHDPTAQRYPPDNRSPADRYPSTGDNPPPGAGEYGEPPAASGEGDLHAQFAALMQSTEISLGQGRLAEVHLELSAWYGESRLSPEEERQLTDLLDRLAGTVIYSRQHLLERPYEVQPGDTLERIADAYEVPWQLLANINGLRDPQHLRQGEQLKVVKGPFHALVDLQKFELVLNVGGRYAGRFRIGIGGDQQTPEGDFVVLKKVVNPTYYGDTVIDANDPNNPLGEYALDLGNRIFLHGTNDPQSIGRADERGCIRLDNRDIKDVFDILTAKSDRSSGSLVKIRYNPASSNDDPAGPSEAASPPVSAHRWATSIQR